MDNIHVENMKLGFSQFRHSGNPLALSDCGTKLSSGIIPLLASHKCTILELGEPEHVPCFIFIHLFIIFGRGI